MKRLDRSGKDYALRWIAGKQAGLPEVDTA